MPSIARTEFRFRQDNFTVSVFDDRPTTTGECGMF
jgi:hypothetical protein